MANYKKSESMEYYTPKGAKSAAAKLRSSTSRIDAALRKAQGGSVKKPKKPASRGR